MKKSQNKIKWYIKLWYVIKDNSLAMIKYFLELMIMVLSLVVVIIVYDCFTKPICDSGGIFAFGIMISIMSVIYFVFRKMFIDM